MLKRLNNKERLSLLVKGAEVYTGGKLQKVDLRIENGVITSMGELQGANGEALFDASGCVLMPGLADVHVHLREPGFSYKETIATGTMAAAAGGYTLVCSMPNLNPAPDSPDTLQQQLEMIQADAYIPVVPYGCITKGQKGEGELVDFKALQPKVCGFSDDGRGVQRRELMAEAMKQVAQLGGMIVAHCEDESLLHGGYIHEGVYAAQHGHKGICSESEWKQVERDLELVKGSGCAYHICHISTKETVELVRRAKADGVNVTCETAPHYLLLCDEDLQEDGCFKMNPPLRASDDRDALIQGIIDGTIDMIATDHAPHSADEKSCGLSKSAFGIVGLESAFALLYTHLVKKNIISLERLIELMVVAPRKRFQFPAEVQVGQLANFTLKELQSSYKIERANFFSMGKAMPFEGWEVMGKPLMTVYNGVVVYKPSTL